MDRSLFDYKGQRKYLTEGERQAFVKAACHIGGEVETFALTIAITGARISEVLALTHGRIDRENSAIVFETLKRRRRGLFRAVPIPDQLIALIQQTHQYGSPNARLWCWGRTTAWKRIKEVMRAAEINGPLATPRAARHAFGIGAIQSGVALNVVQRWMGHARLETTAIYTNAMGNEERDLARRSWKSIEQLLEPTTSHNSN